ncbi:MAG: hypothetical protein Q7K29_01295 [Thermoleophilia bacterium]|nr:hypothetical protein [Thermoleophilia bacterium]
MTKAKLKHLVKKKPVIFTISGALFILIVTFGIVATRPTATKSEFDVNGLNDQVQNHEKRIGDVEDKTDKTQTQTNQNSADVNKLQTSTGTASAPTVPDVHTPVTTVPPPTVTPPPPPDPNNNKWTTSHGTFAYRDIGNVKPMNTGKDVSILFSFSSSSCPGFKANEVNLIPSGTKVVWNSQAFPGQWAMDLSERYNQICSPKMTSYYFAVSFSNDPNSSYFPGKWDLWW